MTTQGREAFEADLRGLGLQPDARTDGRTMFPFVVPVGRFADEPVHLGFDVPPDWPTTPPSGPHVSPRLAQTQGASPGGTNQNVHGSNFGSDFEYWSRPYPAWGRDGRSVDAYLAFLRKLFAEA
ncbi:MAG: hypothetical protein AABM40_04605 [Chloroflexota bacterium]